MIFLEDFFMALNQFVRFHEATQFRCQRPQTFAVLDEFSDLDTDNLNKTIRDKNKPFFYSREWDKNNYNKSNISFNRPILATFVKDGSIKGLFSNKQQIVSHRVEIAYLDQYYRECAKEPTGDECKDRTRNEIFADTHKVLLDLGKFLSEIKYYTEGGKKFGLYHPSIIEAIGKGTAVQEDTAKTREWVRVLTSGSNQEVNVERWDGGIRDLYGHFLTVTLPFRYCNKYEYGAIDNKIVDKGDQGNC